MASLTSLGLNWLRSLFAAAEVSPAFSGMAAVLDGASAVAITEAALAEVAGLSGADASRSLALAWDGQRASRTLNLFDRPLDDLASSDPRGALSLAIGLSLGGIRATAFCSSASLATLSDLLSRAAGQHLPLVMHVVAEGLPAQGISRGSGHEGFMAAADAGWFQLVARNAQEASDLALVARWVAERALVPGMVLMDGEETARAVADLRLPDPRLIATYLGASTESIEVADPAQRLVFGPTRRRTPRWFDLDNPALVGATYTDENFALAAAGNPFFTDGLLAILREGMEALGKLTGRTLAPVEVSGPKVTSYGVLCAGSAVESAQAIGRFDQTGSAKVVALRVLRPFPSGDVANALSGLKAVAVLDRSRADLSSDTPLTREVRAALSQAGENARFGANTHAQVPAIPVAQQPLLVSASWGMGGQALRPTDLQKLLSALEDGQRGPFTVGVRYGAVGGESPARAAVLDAVKTGWPSLARRGVRGDAWIDIRPQGSITFAVFRREGSVGGDVAAGLSHTLVALMGGGVRGYAPARPVGSQVQDRLTWSPGGALDAGADNPADVALVLDADSFRSAMYGLALGGALICARSGEPRPHLLPANVLHYLEEREIRLYVLGLTTSHPVELMLGTLFAAAREKGLLDFTDRAVFAARRKVTSQPAAAESFDQAVRDLWRVELPSQSYVPVERRARRPLTLGQQGALQQTATHAPRFWQAVGMEVERSESVAMQPDPYLASGLIPPLTASFRDVSGGRSRIPVFQPERCTGCGGCWAACPEAAVGPVAFSAQGLVETALRFAEASGTRMDALLPVMDKLIPRVEKLFGGAKRPQTGGEALRTAFDWLYPLLPVPNDRKADIRAAFEAACSQVDALPIATTTPLYGGAKALLSLAINPDACKGCGLCAASCDDGAWVLEDQTPELVQVARDAWSMWERLPDTPVEVIETLLAKAEIPALSIVQLSKSLLLTLPGGDMGEAGSGQRLAVRAALVTADAFLQPVVRNHLAQMRTLEEQLTARASERLLAVLPDEGVRVAEGLQQGPAAATALGDLFKKAEATGELGRGAALEVQQLLRVAHEVAQLRVQLAEGPSGLGRARVGVVVAPGTVADWATVFPLNPFLAPSVLGTAETTAALARGLVEAVMRQAVEMARVLRGAEAALERPQTAAQEAPALMSLGWEGLSETERAAVPPILLIGDEVSLLGRGLSGMAELLRGLAPVKVLVLSEGDLGASRVGFPDSTTTELGLIALAHPGAVVVQSSLSHPEHFMKGVKMALAHAGPALIRVHAPAPGRHGFATDATLRRAAAAVSSRVFPLFSMNPASSGVFGSRLCLEGNPDWASAWSGGTTPAHFAAGETRFDLLPLSSDVEGVSLFAWLDGAKGVPTVEIDGVVLAVTEPVAKAVMERATLWGTLQELAGVKTPFTAEVRATVEAEMTRAHARAVAEIEAKHLAEVAALQAKHAEALAVAREQAETEVAGRVHARLLALLGQRR